MQNTLSWAFVLNSNKRQLVNLPRAYFVSVPLFLFLVKTQSEEEDEDEE